MKLHWIIEKRYDHFGLIFGEKRWKDLRLRHEERERYRMRRDKHKNRVKKLKKIIVLVVVSISSYLISINL